MKTPAARRRKVKLLWKYISYITVVLLYKFVLLLNLSRLFLLHNLHRTRVSPVLVSRAGGGGGQPGLTQRAPGRFVCGRRGLLSRVDRGVRRRRGRDERRGSRATGRRPAGGNRLLSPVSSARPEPEQPALVPLRSGHVDVCLDFYRVTSEDFYLFHFIQFFLFFCLSVVHIAGAMHDGKHYWKQWVHCIWFKNPH